MKTSQKRINRIKAQGYFSYSDLKIDQLAFGNRFAYIFCSVILIIGVITANTPILLTMLIIAILGVILPHHPFDYIYNHVLKNILKKPKLPPRSRQLKFACSTATLFIMTTLYLFYNQFMFAGYTVGFCLIASAVTVSFTDICVPSIAYNYLFKVNTNKS